MSNIFSHRFLYASPFGDLVVGLCGGRLQECRWCPETAVVGPLLPVQSGPAAAGVQPSASDAAFSFVNAVSSPVDSTLIAFDGLSIVDASVPSAADGMHATATVQPFTVDAVPSAADAALEVMVRRQFDEYFRQERRTFSLPLCLPGTPFRQRVWQALQRVPYGGRMSYRMLAEAVGNARAARAVAQACHYNPVAIVVPCHRIVGSDGSLVGYAGGLERKRRLLSLEAACPATALPHI